MRDAKKELEAINKEIKWLKKANGYLDAQRKYRLLKRKKYIESSYDAINKEYTLPEFQSKYQGKMYRNIIEKVKKTDDLIFPTVTLPEPQAMGEFDCIVCQGRYSAFRVLRIVCPKCKRSTCLDCRDEQKEVGYEGCAYCGFERQEKIAPLVSKKVIQT